MKSPQRSEFNNCGLYKPQHWWNQYSLRVWPTVMKAKIMHLFQTPLPCWWVLLLACVSICQWCIATYRQPAGVGSGQCFWWSEVDTCGWQKVAAVNQTAGRSAGISTGSLAGWMMEEELHQLSRSDLKVQPQYFFPLISEAISKHLTQLKRCK